MGNSESSAGAKVRNPPHREGSPWSLGRRGLPSAPRQTAGKSARSSRGRRALTGGQRQMKPSGMLLATAHVPPFKQGIWGHTSTNVSQCRPRGGKRKGVQKGGRNRREASTSTLTAAPARAGQGARGPEGRRRGAGTGRGLARSGQALARVADATDAPGAPPRGRTRRGGCGARLMASHEKNGAASPKALRCPSREKDLETVLNVVSLVGEATSGRCVSM